MLVTVSVQLLVKDATCIRGSYTCSYSSGERLYHITKVYVDGQGNRHPVGLVIGTVSVSIWQRS